MECFTEFDELQEALKRVRMDEDVMPYYRGRLVENEESYAKIQKLLNAPEMQNSHRYLYDLDVENLSEEEIEKVDELFDLGVKKGFIDNSFEEELAKEENPTAIVADEEPEIVQLAVKEPTAPIPCWTVLYSATKNGDTKCGECYSNAISVSAAKADCLAKLNRFGYENVSILAIEAGDPDCAGKADCCNEDDLLKGRNHNAHIAECDDMDENDVLKNRPHNAHVDELNEESDEDSDEEMVDEASGNPYAAGMKVVTGGKASNTVKKTTKTKCVKEDDEEEDASDDSTNDTADDSSEDTSDDSADDNTDDSAEDTTDDTSDSDEESATDDDSGDSGDGDSEDDASEESDDEDSESEDSEDSEESDDEDSEGDDSEEAEELDDDKKAQLKDEYRRIFKEVMLKCGFEDKSFNDLSIEEKVKFFETMKEKWSKNDPVDFLSAKESDQLDAIVVTK